MSFDKHRIADIIYLHQPIHDRGQPWIMEAAEEIECSSRLLSVEQKAAIREQLVKVHNAYTGARYENTIWEEEAYWPDPVEEALTRICGVVEKKPK